MEVSSQHGAREGRLDGVSYRVEGERRSLLTLELREEMILIDPRALFWKAPSVRLTLRPGSGIFKQILSGTPGSLVEARGPGHLGLRRDPGGEIRALHLRRGEALEVQGRQVLACTAHVDCTFRWAQGVRNILLGGTGPFLETISSPEGESLLWLYGHGELFELTLGAGESLDVEPGSWIYKEPGLQRETLLQPLGAFARRAWNRFTGPGRLGLQLRAPRMAPDRRIALTSSPEPTMGFPRHQPWGAPPSDERRQHF
jgi:uncharacterized protein (AIM24 family)